MHRKLARTTCVVAASFFLTYSHAFAFGRKAPSNDAVEDNAGQVLSAFQSGCSSIGSWTAAAQAQMQTFLALLDTIKDRPDCKPYEQQLSEIQSLGSQIQSVSSDPDYIQYRQTQEQVQELTLELQSASDPTEIAALKTALTTAQVNLATDRGTVEGDGQVSDKDRFWTQSGQVASYMGSLMSAVDPLSSPTLMECLEQSPAAAVGLSTNLLSMGGSFISPVFGAASSVLGQLVTVGMEFLQSTPYVNAEETLHSAELPISLSCGLESMSELYCDANDSFSLIQLAANSYDDSAHPSEMWRGLDLLGRRFPVLTDWLTEVKNGVPPSDPTQAGQQSQVVSELEQVETMDLNVTGVINQAVQFYDASNGADSSYIVSGIVSLAESLGHLDNSMVSSSNGGVFTQFESSPLRWACWLVRGPVPDSQCDFPTTPNGIQDSTVQDYVKGTLLANIGDSIVNNLLPNWKAAYQNVYDYVMVQFSQTITTNADALLAEAKEGGNNLSPYQILSETSQFIDAMLKNEDDSNPRLVTTLQDKKKMIEEAQWYIDAPDDAVKDWGDGNGPIHVCPDQAKNARDPLSPLRKQTPAECQRWRLAKIFELFDLKDGVQVFTTDINKFVTWDLQRRLNEGQLPKDVSEILRTAGIDISLRMQAAGLNNLWQVQDDLNNSRKLSSANLLAFRTFFAPSFSETVQDLAKLAKSEPADGPNRPNGELLGRLCTLWMVTSQNGKDFPDKKSAAICEQAKLYSIYAKKGQDGHYIPSLDVGQLEQQLAGKSFMDRVCAYHEYMRQERLAEILTQ